MAGGEISGVITVYKACGRHFLNKEHAEEAYESVPYELGIQPPIAVSVLVISLDGEPPIYLPLNVITVEM